MEKLCIPLLVHVRILDGDRKAVPQEPERNEDDVEFERLYERRIRGGREQRPEHEGQQGQGSEERGGQSKRRVPGGAGHNSGEEVQRTGTATLNAGNQR